MVPEPSTVPEPEDIPIQDADDSIIEMFTDQMINLDESSTETLENFAVTGGKKKRVEVNERKMTDEDRKLFRRAKEAELQSWLDHQVFDVVNKKVADKSRVMRASKVLRWKSTSKTQARLWVLGFQDPDFKEVHPDSTTLSAEALILHVGEVEVGVERHQDGICVKRRCAPQHLHPSSR